jgi:hypothetical protein
MKMRDGLIAVFGDDPYFPAVRSADFSADQNHGATEHRPAVPTEVD